MNHTGGGQTANYLWDVNRGLPEVLQETVGSSTTSYVYGLGRISSTDGSGAQTYYTADGLGSTTDLTNASASKTDGYSYDVFGAAMHSPGSATQPFQFTGEQTDSDSGLQYLRARYYDPATGRFLGRDVLSGFKSFPATQNPYVYALNNPVVLADPSGLSPSNGEGPRSVTINIRPGDNPYLIVNRILSALMPRLDDACLRNYACAQASHARLTALAPVALSLLDLAQRDMFCTLAAGGLLVGGGSLGIGAGTLYKWSFASTIARPQPLIAVTLILVGSVQTYNSVRGILNNC